MTQREPTVFIVDDDPSARRGLTRLVRAAGLAVESFGSAVDFLASDGCDGPGCIVLDVKMPGMTGPELQEKLCRDDYSMPIIFISAHGDVPTTAKAMKKGAVDFLAKPVDREDLLRAIEDSLKKDRERREALADLSVIRERLAKLTPREQDVMRYVITGMLNKQIAGELDISEETVKIHRGRAMHKLGVVSVAELVRLCERAGIDPAPSSPQ
jgi:RNA polymerase sigma factor (sigma-70 family)